jgi:hypothetical protein
MGDTGLKERSLPATIKDKTAKSNQKTADSPLIRQYGKLFLFFGVILPVAAVVFETNTHYCAQHYFDPFPSPAHVVLFLLIPFSNFLAWLSCRRDLSAHYGFMALASGMAMGIGVLYGLMFLPLTPMSCMAIAAFGFGLLGLAPLLSIPCSWLSGKNVCKLASKKKTYFDAHLVEHIGHLIILVMVVAVEAPSTLTRIHLSMAVEPDTAQQGINWLRKYGSEEVMLRACYERSGRATDILGSLYESHHKLNINEARDVFYRVTGKPFNSVAIPPSARATIQHAGLVDDPHGLNAGVVDEFDLDADIAGETVSGVARGVTATSSQITGTIDPNALVGKLDWFFTLTNTFKYDREARAKILLPPGAVVTRATLTVDGVEHEAKIMVRSVARAIYQDAVAQRKDPLLVSTCGTDEILVQCFPVHPNSFMDVKLTIVTPLELLAASGEGALVLPTFSEKNFQLRDQTQVNIKAPTVLVSNIKDLMHRVQPDEGTPVTTVVNVIEPRPKDPNYFADQFVSFTTERDDKVASVYCSDAFRGGAWFISKNIESESFPRPKRLIILLDGSVGMLRWKQEIINGLKQIPSGIPVKVIFFRDREDVLAETQTGSAEYNAALNAIEKLDFLGGQDDSVSLKHALQEALAQEQKDMMAGKKDPFDRAVLWIHGSQPMSPKAGSIVTDLGTWQRPLLYDLQVAPGPNEILAGMEPRAELVRVNRTGAPSTDLAWLWQTWQPQQDHKPTYSLAPIKREAAPNLLIRPVSAARDASLLIRPTSPKPSESIAIVPALNKAPEYMAQLYGYDKLLKAFKQSGMSPYSEAYSLASTYHLVSPVSSAVVVDEIPKLQMDIAPPPVPSDRFENPLNAAFNSVTSQLNRLNMAATNEASRQRISDIEFIDNGKDVRVQGGRGSEGMPRPLIGKFGDSSTTMGYAGNAGLPVGGTVAGSPGAQSAAKEEQLPEPKSIVTGYEPPAERSAAGRKKTDYLSRKSEADAAGTVSSTEITRGIGDKIASDELLESAGRSDDATSYRRNAQKQSRLEMNAPVDTKAPSVDGPVATSSVAAPPATSAPMPAQPLREKVRWYSGSKVMEIEKGQSKPDLGILNQEREGGEATPPGAGQIESTPGFSRDWSPGWFGTGHSSRFYQNFGPFGFGLEPASSSFLDGRSVLVVFWTLIAFIVSMIVGTKHASRRRQGKFCTEYAVQGVLMIFAIPTVVFLMGSVIIRFLPF